MMKNDKYHKVIRILELMYRESFSEVSQKLVKETIDIYEKLLFTHRPIDSWFIIKVAMVFASVIAFAVIAVLVSFYFIIK